MKRLTLTEYPKETLSRLLQGIPFFKETHVSDPDQMELLLSYSKIIEAEPSEVIIKKGEKDNWIYFVLKGQMLVYAEDAENALTIVNQIMSGEVIGAIAAIRQTPRSATIAADNKKVILLGLDFTSFGQLENFNFINLQTKIAFYNMVNNTTRWKLEMYKMDHPEHDLVSRLNDASFYLGERDTFEHLKFLSEQTKELAVILSEWNRAFQNANKASAKDDK